MNCSQFLLLILNYFIMNVINTGKSDPYVRLWLDDFDKSQRTTTKVGTLDPVWNESFKLYVYKK